MEAEAWSHAVEGSTFRGQLHRNQSCGSAVPHIPLKLAPKILTRARAGDRLPCWAYVADSGLAYREGPIYAHTVEPRDDAAAWTRNCWLDNLQLLDLQADRHIHFTLRLLQSITVTQFNIASSLFSFA
jgi:hypothetical protein